MLTGLPEFVLEDFPGASVTFPRMARVRQKLALPRVPDVRQEVRAQFVRIGERIKPGSRVCLAAGSRGIACLPQVVAQVVREVKERGGEPFIIPAMGSHGGATPEGQEEVLAELGITEASMGAPIVSSLDVEAVGKTSQGATVYVSKDALGADAIIVINRVKPHTAFRSDIESGLFKMITIGLGKQKGANSLHWLGFEMFDRVMPEAARLILAKAPIVGGVAIVENAREEAAAIEVLPAEEIEEAEKRLLREAKKLLPRIPFDSFDVLAVQQMGKNISGDGMDPNITGRFASHLKDDSLPKYQKLVVMSLTPETVGNGVGLAQADVVTHRLASELDLFKVYMNAYTSMVLAVSKIPMIMKTERDALGMALRTCNGVVDGDYKVVWILDTLHLEEFWASEPLVREAAGREDLAVVSELTKLEFDDNGRARLAF